jgi:ABC-2 type transport system ATP-binding protein
MQFQPIYHEGNLLIPQIELNMMSLQSIGILTDVRRKQLLIQQLAGRPDVYLFQTQQGEYTRLTVQELIAFLINITGTSHKVDQLLDCFALNAVRKIKIKDLSSSQRMYMSLLRVFFAHQTTLVLEEPYFYLEEQERRQFKQILEELAKEKQVLILTSNLEDAIISCDAIYRIDEMGFRHMDIQDSEEEKQEELDSDQASIVIQKISTKRNDKVILFDPPEIDYMESIEGEILVHVSGERYACAMTLSELEHRLQHYGFFRCHRSYIVNLQKVREIITWTKNSYSLRLNTGKEDVVPLSRSKLQELKTLLNI